MTERGKTTTVGARFVLLTAALSVGAMVVLVLPDWYVPASYQTRYWSALSAFALLAIACDSYFLPLSRISFEKVSSSVAFIPLLAAVLVFEPPWPAMIGGLTALIVNIFVRRKPFARVWFNTAQYTLAVGLGGLVYKTLGGRTGFEHFSLTLLPFCALVVTFFSANLGSVSLGVVCISGVSVREAWTRIVGGSLPYDLVSSSLAVLLAFLYAELELKGLAILVVPLFLVRHMYQMKLHAEQVNRELLELMVKAIEARDPYTSGHSVRVAEYARNLARELGLSTKEVDQIATAALLHDVGKIYEEFAGLLRKSGRLTVEERVTMQSHSVRSSDLVNTVAGFRGAVQLAIKHHHENYDGSGYPDGLAGEEIPIGARIIMIADTIDAMTTDRPYRPALSIGRAIEEIEKHAGRQFDPNLVRLVSKSVSVRKFLDLRPANSFSPPMVPAGSGRAARPAWAEQVAR